MNKNLNDWQGTLPVSEGRTHVVVPIYLHATTGTGKQNETAAHRGAQARMICIASSFGLGPETRGEMIGWVMPA